MENSRFSQQANSSKSGEYGWPDLWGGYWAMQHHTEETWEAKVIDWIWLSEQLGVPGKGKVHRRPNRWLLDLWRDRRDKGGLFLNDFQKRKYFQVKNYFTDNYYFNLGGEKKTLGGRELQLKWYLIVNTTDLKRRLVRKVNIWIPIYDDSCFDWSEDASAMKIKENNCQELGGGCSGRKAILCKTLRGCHGHRLWGDLCELPKRRVGQRFSDELLLQFNTKFSGSCHESSSALVLPDLLMSKNAFKTAKSIQKKTHCSMHCEELICCMQMEIDA